MEVGWIEVLHHNKNFDDGTYHVPFVVFVQPIFPERCNPHTIMLPHNKEVSYKTHLAATAYHVFVYQSDVIVHSLHYYGVSYMSRLAVIHCSLTGRLFSCVQWLQLKVVSSERMLPW